MFALVKDAVCYTNVHTLLVVLYKVLLVFINLVTICTYLFVVLGTNVSFQIVHFLENFVASIAGMVVCFLVHYRLLADCVFLTK